MLVIAVTFLTSEDFLCAGLALSALAPAPLEEQAPEQKL
jgi:hypothetical protein